MKTIEIFSYGIAFVAVVIFAILIFRKKADIDYMQEWDEKISKVINSSTRIMFFVLNGWAVFYLTYQMMHPLTGGKSSIDLIVIITVLSVAWGGKAGIDAIKKPNPKSETVQQIEANTEQIKEENKV